MVPSVWALATAALTSYGTITLLVQDTKLHEFSMAGTGLDRHGSRLKDRHGDLCHRQWYTVGFLRWDDRRVVDA